jgi:hypothetical protein
MPGLLADESFNNKIVQGLLKQQPNLDLVHVQDVGLTGRPDPEVLEWAAQENRVVLTHDKNTMTKYAYARLRAGQPLPGLLVVPWSMPIGVVIENILIMLGASLADEWEGQVRYVSL